jgi:hypothetical protein
MQQWLGNYFGTVFNGELSELEKYLVTKTSQWIHEQRGEVNEAELQQARDEELEACCEWVETDLYSGYGIPHEQLRAARRPKPPSLKEQALEEVGAFEGMGTCNIDIIRRALEALPDKC